MTAAPQHCRTDLTFLTDFLHHHDTSRAGLGAGPAPLAMKVVYHSCPINRIERDDPFGTEEIAIVTVIACSTGKASRG